MTRRFRHIFYPLNQSPIRGAFARLTVNEIEDCGVREILQTPGPALGSWTVLDELLENDGPNSSFVFREPLGQSREVKVALSGLFGRFVARAYLERYLGIAFFAHLGRSTVWLDGRKQVEIERKAPGDLPDWLACDGQLSNLTVAEAKGSHDPSGPNAALGRAWNQANRINVIVGGRRAATKRVAIATRWASVTDGPSEPILAVKDPDDKEDTLEEGEREAALMGVARLHYANLLEPLGYPQLASDLRKLTSTFRVESANLVRDRALERLNELPTRTISADFWDAPIEGTIGQIITRAGPIQSVTISSDQQETLSGLGLYPRFVGVERRCVKAVVLGDLDLLRGLTVSERRAEDISRRDAAGSLVVRIGDGVRVH